MREASYTCASFQHAVSTGERMEFGRHVDPYIRRQLRVNLPTIWTDGEVEVGRVRDQKRREEKIREEKEPEERRCRRGKR